MYKAAVFDLDGTLIDSPLCLKSVRQELGIPFGEYILEHLEGLPFVDRQEKMAKLEALEVAAAQKAQAMPGIPQLLHDLRQRKWRVGIFTRNCRAATHHAISELNLSFDRIITREDAPAKPDPTGLRIFLHEWQLGGSELLFIGDFRFDIECGKKAGVRTALFTGGKEYDDVWAADHVLPDYKSFWQILGL